eukprot:CAMPEP_0183743060 /NCGR_PEP_ID=MMETSP0737-20130205/65022_1 /TAXON_ID=385413 /ORGANISM="Thalassiosira miniscula, Strain CCMP1093" /LENGTH=208 /DNA_ID=CAMNT_0025978663 /DNA_START=13 /DNA_END=639 /DNA_ORIENTATION=-
MTSTRPPFLWLAIATLLAAIARTTSAFSSPLSFSSRSGHINCIERQRSASTSLHLQRDIGGRHFQLEELEDSEASTTDILLNNDRSVTLGSTNGPLYIASSGIWSESCQFLHEDQENPDEFRRSFEMKLARTFVTGDDNSQDATDIGEFQYEVERTYVGECYLVGGSVFAMNGEILDVDEIFGERRVGFFNMIDTTEERENNAMDVGE